MDHRGRAAAGEGKLEKIKKEFKKLCGGKKGEETQGIELSNMSNSRARTTGQAYLPRQNTLPPLPTFQRNTPGRSARHARVDSQGLPVIQDVGNLLHRRRHRFTVAGSCGPNDKPEATEPLPTEWDQACDRFICWMDYHGRDVEEIAVLTKKYFPEIKDILSAAMIDKRLRQLDQIPDIDYWRKGPEELEDEWRAEQQAQKAAKFLQKENLPVRDLPPNAPLRMKRSRAGMQASNNSLRGLAQSQSGSTVLQGRNSGEPTTPTRSAITPETRRRDAAYRASRSRTNLRAASRTSGQSGRISE